MILNSILLKSRWACLKASTNQKGGMLAGNKRHLGWLSGALLVLNLEASLGKQLQLWVLYKQCPCPSYSQTAGCLVLQWNRGWLLGVFPSTCVTFLYSIFSFIFTQMLNHIHSTDCSLVLYSLSGNGKERSCWRNYFTRFLRSEGQVSHWLLISKCSFLTVLCLTGKTGQIIC